MYYLYEKGDNTMLSTIAQYLTNVKLSIPETKTVLGKYMNNLESLIE